MCMPLLPCLKKKSKEAIASRVSTMPQFRPLFCVTVHAGVSVKLQIPDPAGQISPSLKVSKCHPKIGA